MNKEFIEAMKANVEKMVGEFELDLICKVSVSECYSYPVKEDKEFYGIMLYPTDLQNVSNYIHTIIDKEDVDTITIMHDLFQFIITPNMLLTRTNTEIMNRVAEMLNAYKSSMTSFIYSNKDVSSNQKLLFDYDREVYVYMIDNDIFAESDESFQYIK